MAVSISLQNGATVLSESSANHEVKFYKENDKLSLKLDVAFPKNAAPIRINEKRVPENEFEMGEIEILLAEAIGQGEVALSANSDADGHYLNIKITCNNKTFKKWMFAGADDKKWMLK